MAAALSAANPQGFLADIDESMPGYNRLGGYGAGAGARIPGAVEHRAEHERRDDQKRTVEADWLMTLRPVDAGTFSKPEGMASATREKVLKCTAVKQGRKWKIASLDPLDFFAPPAA